jgi:hypothetical protein
MTPIIFPLGGGGVFLIYTCTSVVEKGTGTSIFPDMNAEYD